VISSLLTAVLILAAARPAVPPAQDVTGTLLLIGDAGDPAPGGEPVLAALAREIAHDPTRTAVVFLGDNLYETGLAAPGFSGRAEEERRLDTQVDMARASGARTFFVPGNHDWAGESADGWNSIRRQGERIDARGEGRVEMEPKGGCPGPVVEDVGPSLRLVLLDTQWWLHSFDKPVDPTSSCPQDSEAEVLAALNEALQTAGARHVVVAAHHPLATGGPHGGYFTFKQHVFPLTDARKGFWLPLPLIGSLYPLARKAGATSQDIASAVNARMRESLESVFREHPPLVYASGHEHALQVIKGNSARNLLVSGAGIYDHESAVRRIAGTRYVSGKAGFMKLQVASDGRVRLGVFEVDKRGGAVERYAEWLADERLKPAPGRP
jgi:hypothetical protein